MGMYTSHHLTARLNWPGLLFLAFVRRYCSLQVIGLDHVPTSGAFILAANHSSHADTAVIYASLSPPHRKKVLAAAARDYFFDNGLRQYVSRVLFNTIPVAREPKKGEDPLRHVVRALREEYGVLLFPEGTRSQSGEIGMFRSGIGRLIAEFPGLTVIPTLLQGTDEVMPKKAMFPRPRPVTLHYGAPISDLHADLEDKSTWRAAAEKVRDAVIHLKDEQPADAKT